MRNKIPASPPKVVQEPFYFHVVNAASKFAILVIVVFLLISFNIQQQRIAKISVQNKDLNKSNKTLLTAQQAQFDFLKSRTEKGDAAYKVIIQDFQVRIDASRKESLDTKRKLTLFCVQNHFNCKGIYP